MITQFYDPESGSAALPGSIARALREMGIDVEVITAFPNYPRGRLYDGYHQKLCKKEVIHGVPVSRIPIFPDHSESVVGRIANLVSFTVTSSILGAWLARRSHVVLIYSTSTMVGISGLILRHLYRRKYVLYIQDLWPDSLVASGMMPKLLESFIVKILNRLTNLIYRSSAHIAVISPGLKRALVERGVPDDKVDVIYNWVDEAVFGVSESPHELPAGLFTVMYAGNLGEVQGLDTAVRAVALSNQPVQLRLIGDGVAADSLQALALELGVSDRVSFEGLQPIERMSELMAEAHAQLVCLRDVPLFHITLPSKVQAILAAGCAIITSAPGDAAALTEASKAGWTVPPEDPEALAGLFDELAILSSEELIARGERGRSFYEEKLAAGVGVRRLRSVLEVAASAVNEHPERDC